jgi:hypothetical protein
MQPRGALMFGILTDFHAPRRDGGIPTFFDGWYSHRADAEAALDYWRRRMPGADIRLVVSSVPPPHVSLGNGQEVAHA